MKKRNLAFRIVLIMVNILPLTLMIIFPEKIIIWLIYLSIALISSVAAIREKQYEEAGRSKEYGERYRATLMIVLLLFYSVAAVSILLPLIIWLSENYFKESRCPAGMC